MDRIVLKENNIINKEIIFKDKLDEDDLNQKPAYINYVDECDIEEAVKLILHSNSNNFNKIMYSKTDNTVYFFTDKGIDIVDWLYYKPGKHYFRYTEDIKYKPIDLENEELIYKEFSKLLSVDNYDEYSISLYDVKELINKKYNDSSRLNDICEEYLKRLIRDFRTLNFDVYKNKTKLFIDNDDIYVSSNNKDKIKSNKRLNKIYPEILEIHNVLSGYHNYYLNDDITILSNDSKFLISIKPGGCIYITNNHPSNVLFNKIQLPCYDYDANEHLKNALNNNLDNIMKGIFVKINNCPEWSRGDLYSSRYGQLRERKKQLEENKIQDELKNKQTNKNSKAKCLIKKLFKNS